MKRRLRIAVGRLALVLCLAVSGTALAKSYGSGGGHSYSHSSSHSFSSGSHSFSTSGSHSSSFGTSGKSFRSSSGKSYGSGSSWNISGGHSYSSGKTYSSGSSHSSWFSDSAAPRFDAGSTSHNSKPNSGGSGLAFDTAAAQARKEQASKVQFDRFKDAQRPPVASQPAAPAPVRTSSGWGRSGGWYVPDSSVLVTRRVRIYNVFQPYWSRPVVVYNDSYSSFFWWWLLDRSLDDRAWWAYNHRYDMDPARYQALVANDQQLEARVQQLEAQQAARDPSFVPAGLDRDLMYSDQYVSHAYSNRPTAGGRIAFWFLGVPLALAFCGSFIWLIWFKRW